MDDYRAIARQYAEQFGIPADLFMRQIQAESAWNPAAVSPAGAFGFGQLMPTTAQDLGVDIMNPQENLYGAAKYLRQMYDRFGNWRLALAAYNAGPGRVEQYGGIPPFKETQNYVSRILGERDTRMSTSNSPQSIADDAMSALGMRGREMPQQQPMGLLEQLGIQKMGSGGPQGNLPFYQRDRFKDTAGALALALNDMQLRPGQGVAQNVAMGRQRRDANRTAQWLAQQPGGAEFVQMLEAGADPAQVLMAYRQSRQPGAQTAAAQNYAAYQQILATQGPEAAEQFLKIAGGGGPNITFEGDQPVNPISEEYLKLEAAEMGAFMEAGSIASRNLGEINRLEALLSESGSGMGAALVAGAGNLGIELGENAGPLQAAQALISKLVPQQRPPGSGPMSDADLALFKQSLPRLINTPEGNRLIIEGMRRMAEYDQKLGQIARKYGSGQMNREEYQAAIQNLNDETQSLSSIIENLPGENQASIPAEAIKYLRANPSTAAQFDAKYGAGAAARVLGQ